jgi:four helix bundle protein
LLRKPIRHNSLFPRDLASPGIADAATRKFPKEERYGLSSQFRRAAVSIAANIAEGFRKRTRVDKARFLNTAGGSVEECRYYLVLSHDLGYMDTTTMWPLCEEVSRLLTGYRGAILRANSDLLTPDLLTPDS